MTVLRKTKFIAEITKFDNTFDCVFFLESIERKEAKSGTVYWTTQLRDKSGAISAKVWHDIENPPPAGSFVKVRATASEYRGTMELKLQLIRMLTEEEVVAAEDFVPVGPHDRFEQMRKLEGAINTIRNKRLLAVCRHILTDPTLHMSFRDAPAAKSMHHAYVGGLLDHVLSLIRLVDLVCMCYQADRDLLITAAVWHDIGKTRELTWVSALGYSVEGTLIGHIGIGLQMLDRVRNVFWAEENDELQNAALSLAQGQATWNHLLHIVGSHHGHLDWGAIKLPMSKEAHLFHLLDMIDSRMELFRSLEGETLNELGFSGWLKALNGPMWRQE